MPSNNAVTPTRSGKSVSPSFTITPERSRVQDDIGAVGEQLKRILLGKNNQIRLALACLFARGHLLIEDLPGMGKTLLSQALARVLGLSYNRVQFTSDVLPSDIIGASIYDRDSGGLRFVAGPLFAQVVLADEINRATPKTQSALLEAMEERQVTVEGQTRFLPEPFFVIATQNPVTQSGTFALPESQLDRFLMRISLGYPDPDAERELLRGGDQRRKLPGVIPVLDLSRLQAIQAAVDAIKVSEPLLEYVQRLVAFTRQGGAFAFGLSPRGTLALLHAARAWALLDGRSHVVPEDVQAVLPGVVEHRLREAADFAGHGGGALAQRLLASVNVV
jgi:MoxR-like ATPase